MLLIPKVSILSEQTKIAPKQPFLLSPVVTLITPPRYPSRIYRSIPTNLLIPNWSTYKWGRREGVIKYSGKYVKIYFNMKITFVTIRSLNT